MMKAFAEDGIEIGKLTDGIHVMNWNLDAEFFKAFEGSIIREGKVEAAIRLERAEGVFQAELEVRGSIQTICDNCLEEIASPFTSSLNFVIKLTELPTEDDIDNEVFYVQDSDPRFFVAQHIYDLVYLGLPIRKTCKDPGNAEMCNLEVLGRMDSSKNKSDSEDGNDPRWDKLKDLYK